MKKLIIDRITRINFENGAPTQWYISILSERSGRGIDLPISSEDAADLIDSHGLNPTTPEYLGEEKRTYYI